MPEHRRGSRKSSAPKLGQFQPTDLNDRLLHTMSGIDKWLRAKYQRERESRVDFTDLLSRAVSESHLDGRDREDLYRLWEVRNILAHDYADGRPPINASLAGLTRAEQLSERLTGHLPRLEMFVGSPRKVLTTTPTAALSTALRVMSEHDYTSLPVLDDGGSFVELLSSQDIVVWLGRNLERDELAMDVPVEEVMRESGPEYEFVERSLPQRDARRRFDAHVRATGVPLMAMLITEHGVITETILGIVTPWDLPYLTPSSDRPFSEASEGAEPVIQP